MKTMAVILMVRMVRTLGLAKITATMHTARSVDGLQSNLETLSSIAASRVQPGVRQNCGFSVWHG